jgi:hypothetical protein
LSGSGDLRREGFRMVGPDVDGYAHRYERDGVVIDVLAPDGIRPPPSLGPGVKAISAPGGLAFLALQHGLRSAF